MPPPPHSPSQLAAPVSRCPAYSSSQAPRRASTNSKQQSTPASYWRGGTSRAVLFQKKDLPDSPSQRAKIFLQVIGSPDPHGRQLNGLGAGISSLSKICIVSPSSHPEADVDYTFVGIGIERDEVDTAGNCGNMSAAIGPFAFNKRLIKGADYSTNASATVRIHNTNTGVIICSSFPTIDGEASTLGDYIVDGVAGTGAQINLDFLRPGGSKTGKLLPTGSPVDVLDGTAVSCVDAAGPCIFVRASDLDVDGTLLPNEMNARRAVLQRLEELRQAGAMAMGMCKPGSPVPRVTPKIGIVSPAVSQKVLSGETIDVAKLDLVVRFISDQQPHRAIPITAALCTGAAAKIQGTIVQQCLAGEPVNEGMVTIGHPSGQIQVNATMDEQGEVECATVFRTARRIMEGEVFWNE
ncbi:DUF453-domain-containing protein [Aulographum hederae CBS 113979]|uniref:DUF453-domain-containing protein n=1 Tax=Aulographum hederae CBS 113979 TaxID=1176131 RepID=A0A6G1HEG2_9PEZI|nr:DUF453-domain-containing protein [Aulographum hederae CBS 113979]